MTALKDPRPHVFLETDADRDGRHPAVILGALVTQLLEDHPDVDLPTIRLWLHQADGVRTLRIDARRGELAGVECPQCHQPAGRPHTDYCTLRIREEIFAGPSAPSLIDQVLSDQHGQTLGQTSPPGDCTCSGLLGRTIPGPQHTAGCPMRIRADR